MYFNTFNGTVKFRCLFLPRMTIDEVRSLHRKILQNMASATESSCVCSVSQQILHGENFWEKFSIKI